MPQPVGDLGQLPVQRWSAALSSPWHRPRQRAHGPLDRTAGRKDLGERLCPPDDAPVDRIRPTSWPNAITSRAWRAPGSGGWLPGRIRPPHPRLRPHASPVVTELPSPKREGDASCSHTARKRHGMQPQYRAPAGTREHEKRRSTGRSYHQVAPGYRPAMRFPSSQRGFDSPHPLFAKSQVSALFRLSGAASFAVRGHHPVTVAVIRRPPGLGLVGLLLRGLGGGLVDDLVGHLMPLFVIEDEERMKSSLRPAACRA